MKRWIKLRPYDRPEFAHKTKDEWVWINADKIEMMEEGSPYKNVTPPHYAYCGRNSCSSDRNYR